MPLLRLAAIPGSIVGLALLVACGGSSEDEPLYLRGSPVSSASPTATLPDADGDRVPDGEDQCPDGAERPGGIDVQAPDGCPDSLDDLVAFAIADIGKYWQTRLSGIVVAYVAPEVIAYDSEGRSACGRLPLNNAFYCGLDNGIYYDRGLMEREFTERGDFAPFLILAHEWGHLVQAHIGLFGIELHSIDYELQADCMAGVYARNANQRKLLALGDLETAAAALFAVGDESGIEWYDEGAHGTPDERVFAFRAGFDKGLGVCATVADEARKR